jgi:uncharacterized membrane protein YhhN
MAAPGALCEDRRPMSFFVAWTLAGLAALLFAEWRGAQTLRWIAKPLASLGFVAAGHAAGALASPYGGWIFAGLVLGALGDVLLIPRGRPFFAAGLASFLLGHLAYVGAFAVRGFALGAPLLAVALAAALAGALALRWLLPHVPASLRLAVPAYVVVISCMLVAAAATCSAHGDWARVFVGAAAFYGSDFAVARERFVAKSFTNKSWGLPLYYGGQLLLAASVAGR